MTTQAMPPARKRFRLRWRSALGCLALVLIVGCVAGVFVAGRLIVGSGEASGRLTAQVVEVERRDLVESVQINSTLEPRERARVSFAAGVRVDEVLVAEGDRVENGQVLARLETRDLELKVASSQAQLDQAQQTYAKLEAGPDDVQLLRAAAAVERAKANLAASRREVRQVDIDNAKQQRDVARQRLADLQNGIEPDSLSAAETNLLAAQEDLTARQVALDRTRDAASRDKHRAQQAMEQGAQALERAQLAYSDASWDWDHVQHTGTDPVLTTETADGAQTPKKLSEREIEAYRRAFESAADALHNAEVELENLRLAYQDALKSEVLQVQESERAVDSSTRALADARREVELQSTRGLATALLLARKELADAEKAYRDLVDSPTRAASQAELEAALAEALAEQAKLVAGSDPIELAAARTELERARAELAQAQADLDAATLRAPIAGTVVDITLQEGTSTTAQDAIAIADLSSFLIRGNVTEDDVVEVKVGLAVMVQVDSVPTAVFSGTVTRVSELPDEQGQSGDASQFTGNPSGALGGLYPIEIVVVASDDRLRVGMANTANIQLFAIPAALVVPLQAVQDGLDGPFVLKVSEGAGPEGVPPSEPVSVRLGKASGDSVQVLSGLAEGDRVVLQELPPPENQFGPGGP